MVDENSSNAGGRSPSADGGTPSPRRSPRHRREATADRAPDASPGPAAAEGAAPEEITPQEEARGAQEAINAGNQQAQTEGGAGDAGQSAPDERTTDQSAQPESPQSGSRRSLRQSPRQGARRSSPESSPGRARTTGARRKKRSPRKSRSAASSPMNPSAGSERNTPVHSTPQNGSGDEQRTSAQRSPGNGRGKPDTPRRRSPRNSQGSSPANSGHPRPQGRTRESASPGRSPADSRTGVDTVNNTASVGPLNPRSDSLRRESPRNTPSTSTPQRASADGTPASVVLPTPLPATPARRRDLGTSPLRLSPSDSTEGSPGGEQYVVWGTNFNYDETLNKFKDFFEKFSLPLQDEPLYVQLFKFLEETDGYVLNVDMNHVAVYNKTSYDSLVNYPTEVIPILDYAANDVFGNLYPESHQRIENGERQAIQTRPYGLPADNLQTMRDLNPKDISTLIGVQGMIIRVSPVIPDIQSALYRCNKCFHTNSATIQYGRIEEPRTCDSCGTKDSYALLHTRSTFSDKQMMRLQEAPESVPKGETPATFTLVLYDNLVDSAKPGDRVEVTGILRASPVRLNPKMRSVRSVFRTYIDCVHVAKINNNAIRITQQASDILGQHEADTATQRAAKEKVFDDLACSPLLYEKLADSLAPSIFGMQDEKKGVLLQLFGGVDKDETRASTEGGSSQFRSAINILLVGDPGTSKSQLLQSAHRLAPRGVYTSGRGSSAVGLTAYVTKDPDTNDYVLESGALVLSDRGLCCIDEFDKMSEYARSVLHEAMEQQTVSIAKAGIIATLNARTSILAAANPVGSRYNTNASVVDNIDLPPTLLSRFDLIYLVLDAPNADEDRRLARHIVSLFYKNYEPSVHRDGVRVSVDAEDGDDLLDLTGAQAESVPPSITGTLDNKTLTEYIAYAKRKVHPKLSSEAADALVQGYIEMRAAGRGSHSITATPRQLESLIRLAEAHARMSLKEEVEEENVVEAIRLVKSAIHAAAFDPHTGRIDMDLFALGRSKVNATKRNTLARVITDLLKDMSPGDVKLGALKAALRKGSEVDVSSGDFRDALKSLQEQQIIVYTANGTAVRLIGED